MPKQSALSMRPGTIIGYKGEAYKVISNDTLGMRFQARRIEPKTPPVVKTFRYDAGMTLDVRWVPFTHSS